METREVKFKKYREQIALQNDKPEEFTKPIIVDDVLNLDENYVKKNTLTMSIDQIIEAHDEYTMIVEQKQLTDRLKKEKKERYQAKIKNVLKYLCLCIGLLAIIVVLVVIILIII